MKKKLRFFLILLLAIVLVAGGFVAYICYDNSRIVNSGYKYVSEKVPPKFNGFRIVLITDFHNADNYMELAETVREASPDIICIAGDLVDMNTVNFTNTKKLIRELTSISTVYYSCGNHEAWSNTLNGTQTPVVCDIISKMGVVIMDDSVKQIEIDGESINLVGYTDTFYDDSDGLFEPHAQKTLTEIANKLDKSKLTVLLFHRAQYFDMVSKLPYDIVLSGHLHGGQINIKGIREKILEKHFGTSEYIKGRYTKNGHDMFVCGGTALKDDVYRLFNTPEIVTIELRNK